MQHYMGPDVMQKLWKPLIQCYENSSNPLTDAFVVSHFLRIN